MRSRPFIMLLLAVLLLGLLGSTAVAQDTQTLTVSIWGFNLDVLEANVFAPFEEMYNVDIVLDTGNNSDRLARLQAEGESTEIDVVHFATQFTHLASEAGLLQPYNPDALENLDEVFDWAQDPLGNQAGVGYTVNSLSLIYRADLIENDITSWADLLRDDVAGYVSIPEMSTTFGPATLIMIDRALAMADMDDSDAAPEINYDAGSGLGSLAPTGRQSGDHLYPQLGIDHPGARRRSLGRALCQLCHRQT